MALDPVVLKLENGHTVSWRAEEEDLTVSMGVLTCRNFRAVLQQGYGLP